MKWSSPLLFSLVMIGSGLVIFYTACKKSSSKIHTSTYSIYAAVKLDRSEVLASINGNPDEPIDSAGKIYVKDKYIFINEPDKGIHVINNSNPAQPVQTAFLKIPGNKDIAIRSNFLYADMFSELLTLDISNLHDVTVMSDLQNVFPNYGYSDSDTSGLIIGFTVKDTTVTWEDGGQYPAALNEFYSGAATNDNNSTGKAGSMARMVLMNDHLYAVAESHSVSILNLSVPGTPRAVSNFAAGFDLETIFPFEGKLFLGSSTGMFMFDVSNPEQPAQLGTFSHGRACDPVIADGDLAYVTLHSGTYCGGAANELDVINIKDLMNPSLVKSYPLTGPKGLSKDGDLLFVCDGPTGVKLFQSANSENLSPVSEMQCPDPYDVITGNSHALVVNKEGLYQFDYSNRAKPTLLSVFKTRLK